MSANDEDGDQAARVVIALLDAVQKLSTEDGPAIFTLSAWLAGVPARRLLAVLRRNKAWGIAHGLIGQERDALTTCVATLERPDQPIRYRSLEGARDAQPGR